MSAQYKDTQIIPAQLMQELNADQKMDSREMIVQFLITEPGFVKLTPKQEELLARWEKADELMRSGHYTNNEVVAIMRKAYKYSPAAARRDLADAQHVFSNSNKPNKSYLLTNHVHRIEAAMQYCQKIGDMDAYAKLAKAYTDAVAKMPDDSKLNPTPAAIIFNIDTQKDIRDSDEQIADAEVHAITGQVLESRGLDKNDYMTDDAEQ